LPPLEPPEPPPVAAPPEPPEDPPAVVVDPPPEPPVDELVALVDVTLVPACPPGPVVVLGPVLPALVVVLSSDVHRSSPRLPRTPREMNCFRERS
jgi:hypothetical protein